MALVPGREWRLDFWLDSRQVTCTQAEAAEPGTGTRELLSELCTDGYFWRGGDAVNMSVGQGDVQMSPMQVANMFAAVANRGPVLQPHVVRAVLGNDDEPVLVNEPEVLHEVPVSAEHFGIIEQGLVPGHNRRGGRDGLRHLQQLPPSPSPARPGRHRTSHASPMPGSAATTCSRSTARRTWSWPS